MVISLILSCSANSLLEIDYTQNIRDTLVDAISDILHNFFMTETTTISLIKLSKNPTNALIQNDIVTNILTRSNLTFFIENYDELNQNVNKRFFNLLLVDDYDSFR